MKGLLDPSVKYEVNFAKAARDCSNILIQWSKGKLAGTRAFIPDLNDRDECYAGMKIYAYAEEESIQIPNRYVEHFGEDSIHMYNMLIKSIGKREGNCVPL